MHHFSNLFFHSKTSLVCVRTAAGLLIAVAVLFAPTLANAEPLTHETVPALTDAELGHLRNFVALTSQDLDDWSGWEAQDQKNMEAYRYQIAFMAYALSFQQYHSVPAYRDLYQDTLSRLVTRMIQKPVWEFWEEVSKSSPSHDPDWKGPVPGWRDPVREKNIMYSGHIVHMVALYEMLYRDFQWSEEGALTFEWSSDESYVYDMPTLSKIIRDEMMAPRKDGRDIGAMECEPNAVFPECNQHPTLAFMLSDQQHGTDLSVEVRKAFKNFFLNTDMYRPETQHAEAYYRINQDDLLKMPGKMSSASADGWTGAFMHGWDPEYIESMYAKQRDDFIRVDESTGKVTLAPDFAAELNIGFFANLAVEVGDVDAANLLFDYADEHMSPVTKDGALHYQRNMGGVGTKVSNTTDKLIGLARSNRPNGIFKLHNEPWTTPNFKHPLLEKVDFPRVLVRQAIWDEATGRLLFTLVPGSDPLRETTFGFTNLNPERTYTLMADGKSVASISGVITTRMTVPMQGMEEFTLQESTQVAALGAGE